MCHCSYIVQRFLKVAGMAILVSVLYIIELISKSNSKQIYDYTITLEEEVSSYRSGEFCH